MRHRAGGRREEGTHREAQQILPAPFAEDFDSPRRHLTQSQPAVGTSASVTRTRRAAAVRRLLRLEPGGVSQPHGTGAPGQAEPELSHAHLCMMHGGITGGMPCSRKKHGIHASVTHSAATRAVADGISISICLLIS